MTPYSTIIVLANERTSILGIFSSPNLGERGMEAVDLCSTEDESEKKERSLTSTASNDSDRAIPSTFHAPSAPSSHQLSGQVVITHSMEILEDEDIIDDDDDDEVDDVYEERMEEEIMPEEEEEEEEEEDEEVRKSIAKLVALLRARDRLAGKELKDLTMSSSLESTASGDLVLATTNAASISRIVRALAAPPSTATTTDTPAAPLHSPTPHTIASLPVEDSAMKSTAKGGSQGGVEIESVGGKRGPPEETARTASSQVTSKHRETYKRILQQGSTVGAYERLHGFISALLSGRCSSMILSATTSSKVTVSIPGIRTLLLSQKFLLRPFNFKVPNVDYYRLTGHAQLIAASICFGDLIFLMILVNLPNLHPFELLHEMLSTHLNFHVSIDKDKALHTESGRYISCPFFWCTVGLHFMDIPFNLQFHGLLRVSLNDAGLVETARILYDPTVVIRQCDCISQYYKANAIPKIVSPQMIAVRQDLKAAQSVTTVSSKV